MGSGGDAMHSLPRVLVFVSALMLLVTPAFAEDDPAAPEAPAAKSKPDPVIPGYSIEFLMPSGDSVPEGWKVSDRAAAGAPSEDGLTELAESCKLDDDTFYVEVGTLQSGSDKVGIAMLDIDENVWAYRAKLDAQASANGWTVMELGSPSRVVVASGAQAKAALAKLKVHVVYAIGEMAMNRVRGRSAMEAAGQEAALEYTKAIGELVPDTGLAHGLVGRVHWLRAMPKKRGEKPDKALQDKAIASFKKALADGAKHPPKGRVLVWISGTHGNLLMEKKDKSLMKEATRSFEIAVEHEVDAPTNNQRYGNRYNLTCAYARLGRIEDAFKMLKKSIETGKTLPEGQWRQSFKHMEEKDPDLAALREDPRFSKLMADNRPAEPKKRPMPKGHPPVGGDKPKPKDGR